MNQRYRSIKPGSNVECQSRFSSSGRTGKVDRVTCLKIYKRGFYYFLYIRSNCKSAAWLQVYSCFLRLFTFNYHRIHSHFSFCIESKHFVVLKHPPSPPFFWGGGKNTSTKRGFGGVCLFFIGGIKF